MIEKSENRQPFFSINTTNHNLLSPFQTTAVSCLHHLPTTPSGPQPLARFAHHRLRGFRRIGHSEKEGLCEQAPNGYMPTTFLHCSLPTWTLYHNSPLFPMLNISYNLKHLYQYRGYCGQETDIDQLALGQRCYGKQVLHERNEHDNT